MLGCKSNQTRGSETEILSWGRSRCGHTTMMSIATTQETLTIKFRVWHRVALLQRPSKGEQLPEWPPGMVLSSDRLDVDLVWTARRGGCLTHILEPLNYSSTPLSF